MFAALEEGAWNLAFLAIEPVREAQIVFSEPYVLIEGTYLVSTQAPFQAVEELDQAGFLLEVLLRAPVDRLRRLALELFALLAGEGIPGLPGNRE